MKSLVSMLFIALFFISTECAKIDLDKQLNTIPEYVSDITTIGEWMHDGESYFYRVIYVDIYRGCSLLYIQWISNPLHPKLIHTLSIEEFNADDHIEITFEKPTYFETEKGLKIKLKAASGHDDTVSDITISVSHEVGKYEIEGM